MNAEQMSETKMKFVYSQVLFVFAFFCLVQRIDSECKVEADTEKGALKLLEPLAGKTVTASDNVLKYNYTIGFCNTLDDSDAGVIQKKIPSGSKVVVGRINATSIKNGTDWIFLTYGEGDKYGSHCNNESKQSHIILLCNPDTLIGSVSVLEENRGKTKDCYYLFEIQTSVACISNSSSSSSLSFGWILVIIVLIVAAVYLLVGCLYQRFVAQAKGIEQIPNLSFWQKVGGLSADGCDFICRCNKTQDVRSYKGLGDDQLGTDD